MADRIYEEKIQDALVESIPEPYVTLSTGVVLKLKKAPMLRIQAVANKFKYPDIPEVWDKDRERWIQNPDNPDYKKACEAVDMERGFATVDAIVAMGTEIESIPDGVPHVSDNSWIDEMNVVGIEISDIPIARYMSWIKFVAISDEKDLTKITEAATRLMGTSEGRVAGAIRDNFPDHAVR